MWGNPTEVRRLRRLRRTAGQAMNGGRNLSHEMALDLEIHGGTLTARRAGDLDNYVTWVCDGLMAADPRGARAELWEQDKGSLIHPAICLAITDDCEVVSISARKLRGDTVVPWYSV